MKIVYLFKSNLNSHQVSLSASLFGTNIIWTPRTVQVLDVGQESWRKKSQRVSLISSTLCFCMEKIFIYLSWSVRWSSGEETGRQTEDRCLWSQAEKRNGSMNGILKEGKAEAEKQEWKIVDNEYKLNVCFSMSIHVQNIFSFTYTQHGHKSCWTTCLCSEWTSLLKTYPPFILATIISILYFSLFQVKFSFPQQLAVGGIQNL